MDGKQNQSKNPTHLNQSGFTLLEIIAVIVILSIMAVVAVPKYFDLQEQARAKTLKTALAEGIGRINGFFAQQVLSGQTPGEIEYSIENLGADLGDFTMSIESSNATMIEIKVMGNEDTPLDGYSDQRRVTKPGF